jgi:urease accessory protein
MNTDTGAAKRFFLLQMNDALFPVGGYSHSYGLETYIYMKLVRDTATAEAYIEASLRENFLRGDLLCAELARKYGLDGDFDAVIALERLVCASKSPSEIRGAAHKTGSRFLKTMLELLHGHPGENLRRCAALLKESGTPVSRAVAYGLCCGLLSILPLDASSAFLYAQTSAMVTCCVKSVPLSQTDGQKLLAGLFARMDDLLKELPELGEADLYRTSPAFDIRSMQHETLYSRLYMS